MRYRMRYLLASFLLGWLFVCPAFATSLFPDVDESGEYTEAIAYVSEAGIMVGDTQGNFNPNKSVTRAEMATIICRMLGETENLANATDFTDVPANHWANAYVSKAVELGVVTGYGNGKFGPSDHVTYEQAVTMVMRALGGGDLAAESGGYPDGFLQIADEHGFLENVQAKQGEPLSRGDIAILLYNCAYFSFDD